MATHTLHEEGSTSVITSNKPKKAEQMVRFQEHTGSHNQGEVAGFTKAEADVLCAKRKDGSAKAVRIYFNDAGEDITAAVEKEAAEKAAEKAKEAAEKAKAAAEEAKAAKSAVLAK